MKSTAIFVLFLFLVACQAEVETVEIKNEFNQTERFERRKKDFAKHGAYQRFHEDGHLLEEAQFANDTLHGTRKFFFPNGQLERTETFQRGLHHGPVVLYYENGQKQLEQTYMSGVLEGISTKW